MSRHLLAFTISLLVLVAHAAGQGVFQNTGADIRPGAVNGRVTTNAYDDPTGVLYTNVRTFGYSFNVVNGDPYFAQSPGFNAPSNSGLPSRSVLSFTTLSSLYYWNGSGPVRVSAPPQRESVRFNFGANNAVISGSAYDAGFNIGQASTAGAIHRHLNAFLQNSQGSSLPGAGPAPSPGAYFTRMQVNATGLTPSAPISVGFNNGLTIPQYDRFTFWLRNTYAPGSTLAGVQTNLAGLSALPGEASLGTAKWAYSQARSKELDAAAVPLRPTGWVPTPLAVPLTLTAPASRGSVTYPAIDGSSAVDVALWLTGTPTDVSNLITSLSHPGSGMRIAPASAPSTDPLYPTIRNLSGQLTGFSAVLQFDPGQLGGAFTWNFLASAGVGVSQLAVLPDPSRTVELLQPLNGGANVTQRAAGDGTVASRAISAATVPEPAVALTLATLLLPLSRLRRRGRPD